MTDTEKTTMPLEEPLLKETLERYTLFPIKYEDLWEQNNKHVAAFWTAREIKYEQDLKSWESLSKDEKYFIEHILAFFAGADGIVLENLMSNFSQEVQVAEARAFYVTQAFIEQVHSETYSLLIETFIKNHKRKSELFNAIQTIPCVKKKADWAMKWMNKDTRIFAERLIAFIVVEGVFFSGAFCAIFWLKSRGLMVNALGSSNELIARDEGLHAMFGVSMYKYIVNKVPEHKVHAIFKEAVEIEKEFITQSIPCRLIGMNSELMIEYIKYVADYWVLKLGYKKIYNAKNPFPFMVMNNIDGKTNFFEKTVSEYQKASSVTSMSKRTFEQSDDF